MKFISPFFVLIPYLRSLYCNVARIPSPYFLSCVSESCFMSFTFIRPEFLTKNIFGVYNQYTHIGSFLLGQAQYKKRKTLNILLCPAAGRQTLPPYEESPPCSKESMFEEERFYGSAMDVEVFTFNISNILLIYI